MITVARHHERQGSRVSWATDQKGGAEGGEKEIVSLKKRERRELGNKKVYGKSPLGESQSKVSSNRNAWRKRTP